MANEILRPDATFGTTLPDDQVDEEDDVAIWAGRNICEAIRAALSPKGYVVSEPVHAHEHGWELDVSRGKIRYWIQITRLADEECILLTRFRTWRLRGDRPGYRELVLDLAEFLGGDARFNNVRWYNRDGIHKREPSSSSPVSG